MHPLLPILLYFPASSSQSHFVAGAHTSFALTSNTDMRSVDPTPLLVARSLLLARSLALSHARNKTFLAKEDETRKPHHYTHLVPIQPEC